MSVLTHTRCWNHAAREAAVVCPQCRRYYCRECVTEHQGRMMCTTCVAALAMPTRTPRSATVVWIGLAVGGLLLAWLVFYNLGVLLARIPTDFHGGA
jgi:hypothetical protein